MYRLISVIIITPLLIFTALSCSQTPASSTLSSSSGAAGNNSSLSSTSSTSSSSSSSSFSSSFAASGTEQLVNGNFTNGTDPWITEQTGSAKAAAAVTVEGPDGSNSLKVTITAVDPSDSEGWHIQVHQVVSIQSGKSYLLTFWARTSISNQIAVTCMQNHTPWDHHSVELYPSITTNWQKYSLPFNGPSDDTNMRINFSNLAKVSNQIFWFAKCSLLLVSH